MFEFIGTMQIYKICVLVRLYSKVSEVEQVLMVLIANGITQI